MGCRSSYKEKDGSVTAAAWVYMMTCVESVMRFYLCRSLPRLVALPMEIAQLQLQYRYRLGTSGFVSESFAKVDCNCQWIRTSVFVSESFAKYIYSNP
jgi:hypothetical protein